VDFALTEEQQAIRAAVRDLCSSFGDAYWRKLDETHAYPDDFVKALTEGGWLACLIPTEYGGSGLGITEASIILEEVNSTIDLLQDYWAEVREKSDPKKSPAIKALKQILTMGRGAKKNVVGIAQMLTARSIGGPEARENFAVRCLARFSTNAWRMLVPEAAMPRSSTTLGRWQIVVAGVATETQVCFLEPWELRALVRMTRTDVSPGTARATGSCDLGLSPGLAPVGDTPPDPLSELLTLRQATDGRILPWGFDAAKKRLQRAKARNPESVPKVRGKDGLADLYNLGDLIVWAESERVK